jgi:hypothetical protein
VKKGSSLASAGLIVYNVDTMDTVAEHLGAFEQAVLVALVRLKGVV